LIVIQTALTVQFEQSSDSIQIYENENFVYSLAAELDATQNYDIKVFSYVDIFMYDPAYHDPKSGQIFPALRLKGENPTVLDRETICNNLSNQCFIPIKVRNI